MATVKTTIEVITPEMAKEYLTHNIVNRKPNKGQVAYYARMMSEGKWMLNGESIVFDNKGNLSDGQHRLMAIMLAQVPIQSVVVRNVDCESFATIDQGKARSASDSFGIKGIPNGTNVSAAIRRFILMNRYDKVTSMETVAHGCSTHTSGTQKVSAQEHIDEYNARPDFWQNEWSFGNSCYGRCRLMSTSDVMAISAYLQLTKGYNAEVVHDFFNQIFFEECSENNTLALFRRMVVNDAMAAKGVRMTTKYKTQLLIKCWEAFKKNKEYKRLYWVKEVEGEYTFE